MVIHLDDWQKQVLETKGNIALRSGRQTGKSTIISILAARHAVENPNHKIMIIASVERQAYELFSKVVNYMEATHPKHIKKGRANLTKTKMVLTNGSIIYCLPTGLSGANIRGYTIDLLIADEAAFIPDEVFNAVIPSIAARVRLGARIILLSTPFGRDNYFYDCFQDETFTHFHISSEECERIDKKWLEQQKQRMSEVAYAQEFLGEFADGLMQFFPDDLIKECMILERPNHPPIPEYNYYIGSDLSRLGDDLTTYEIFYERDGILKQVDNIVKKKQYLNETAEDLIRLDKEYNFKKMFIDSEGIGVAVFDFLGGEVQTRRKVIGVKNSTRIQPRNSQKPVTYMKEELYALLLDLMRRKKIQLLQDPDIYYSLRQIRYEYTSDQQGKSFIKIWGKDSHITEGLIRAALAQKWISLNIWLSSFKV